MMVYLFAEPHKMSKSGLTLFSYVFQFDSLCVLLVGGSIIDKSLWSVNFVSAP